MNTKLKLLSSILALSMLAACGGSDDGPPADDDTELPGPVSEQTQWLSHESAFTSLGISSVVFGLAGISANFIADDFPVGSQACDTPSGGTAGTLVGVYDDVDASGDVTVDDTIDFTFSNCYSEDNDMAVTGTVKVVLGAITGDPLDEEVDSNVLLTFSTTDLVLDDETTLKTTGLRFGIDHQADDEFETVTTTTQRADGTDRPLTLETDGNLVTISNYIANYRTSFNTDNNTYSHIEYSTTGTDPILGAFDYAVRSTSDVVAASNGSHIDAGVFESVTADGETVTTTFTTADAQTSVKIDSSTGTSSTLTFPEFDL